MQSCCKAAAKGLIVDLKWFCQGSLQLNFPKGKC